MMDDPPGVNWHSEIDHKQMQIDELQAELVRLQAISTHEANVRRIYPTVQDAWEQYQIALRLVE